MLAVGQPQLLGDSVEQIALHPFAVALQLTLQHLLAEPHAVCVPLFLQPASDRVARLRGLHEVEPRLARILVRGSDNLDGVAAAQGGAEGDDLAIHLGREAVQADVGVNGEGEIYRGSSQRQLVEVTHRGEDEDLVLIELDS